MEKIEMFESCDVPATLEQEHIYRLMPNNVNGDYYRERTDRNIGWITQEEQGIIQRTTVGVAGCGGMGGHVAEKFLRLGVGQLRIADSEVFDISNINREYSASALILAHNHPSGVSKPSEADVAITRQIIDAGKILGISLLDHVVITKNKFESVSVEYA